MKLVERASNPTRAAAATAGGGALEKTELRLGIIPLTDCAPIVIAREKGFFEAAGLAVEVSKEASWASIRDKVGLGELDGAHMLAAMPLAATLGVGAAAPIEMVTAFGMDLNGNAITVSRDLHERMLAAAPEEMRDRRTSARALKRVIDEDRRAGRAPLAFAMVYPVSSHNYQLRYWMAAGGIDPDRDVHLTVIPPSQMVDSLSARKIVGYCVGEPWSQRAIAMGIGRCLITGYEIWNNSPEKVFGVTRDWAVRHPNTHRAVIRALIEAARWMDRTENRREVAEIISARAYVDAPSRVVESSMTGTWRYGHEESAVPMPDFNVFHRYAANFPWRSHAVWFLSQMRRWGQLAEPVDFAAVAEAVYRPDIYRAAAAELGLQVPAVDYKSEGTHAGGWVLGEGRQRIDMGADRFVDGRQFDPARVADYLAGFDIHRMHPATDARPAAKP